LHHKDASNQIFLFVALFWCEIYFLPRFGALLILRYIGFLRMLMQKIIKNSCLGSCCVMPGFLSGVA
jgi:hypothetical protein